MQEAKIWEKCPLVAVEGNSAAGCDITPHSIKSQRSPGGRWSGGGSGGGMVGQAHVVEEGPETEAEQEARRPGRWSTG